MNETTKKGGIWINLLVLLIVILFCLVVAEVVLRYAWRGYNPMTQDESMMTYDDTLGWIGKSDYDGWLRESGMTVTCRTNEWGFRDELPLSLDQTEGKYRLMFLGDSFVMGTGLPREARASEILEGLDSNLVCFNFGIFGYSTDQELLVLKKFGPKIKPDHVLLFFCANDLIYNDSDLGHRIPKSHYYLDEEERLILGNVPVPHYEESKTVFTWLKDNFAIGQISYRIFAQVAYKKKQRNRQEALTGGHRNSQSDGEDLDSLLLYSTTSNSSDLSYYLLKEVHDECERQGAALTVLTTPSNKHWTATRDETPVEIQRMLDWCMELGIETLDLFPTFHADYLEKGQTLYLPDDMHWNEAGNRIAARTIHDYLAIKSESMGGVH